MFTPAGASAMMRPLRPMMGVWAVAVRAADDVGEVTEGTDHCDAGAFVGLGKRVGSDGNFDAVERR